MFALFSISMRMQLCVALLCGDCRDCWRDYVVLDRGCVGIECVYILHSLRIQTRICPSYYGIGEVGGGDKKIFFTPSTHHKHPHAIDRDDGEAD